MKDYSNYRPNTYDNIRWSGVKFFEKQLEYEGENVLIDGIQTKVIIRSHTNQFNATNGDRKLLCSLDTNIHRGSIIDYDDGKWIVFVDVSTDKTCLFTKILKSTHTITLNKNHVLYQVPCVVESSVRLYQLGVEENKYLSEPSTNIVVRVPNNSATQLIKRNDIYKIGMQNYKVVDINDIIESGLLILKMEFALDEQKNDSHIYNITILNGNLQISQSQSLILNVAVYEDGEILTSPPPYSFTSSDETIATINNDVVTFLSIGNVDITVTLNNNNEIQDTISIEIISDPINNKTVQIFGSTNITKNYTENYSCIFKNNGFEVVENSIFYLTADDNLSETSLAQIITQDKASNTCTIKGLGLGYIRLFVKNEDNNIVSDSYRIKIENLF